MNRAYFIFSILILLIITSLTAQENTIKGFVYDSQTGEPVGYANIHLEDTQIGTQSDANGSFIITKIPEGIYTVKITFFGYDDFRDTVTLTKTQSVNKRYLLQKSASMLDAVTISADRQKKESETRISVTSITPKDMAKMPAIGGQPDFAQYIQVVPGIVSTGDQGGQIYVRGGTPIQNMLLLDGMLVLNPFHSIGLFSVFDTDIIGSADIYTGGFGAEFGGRISSVMNLQTREGNKKRLSGKIDINTFGAKLLLEGPFIKMNESKGNTLSYILSVKGSYLEQSSKVLYPYLESSLPYNYMDVYGKVAFSAANGSKLSFFGFYFDDQVNYSELANFGWNNGGAGTRFLIVPNDVPMTIDGTIAYSHYVNRLEEKVEGYDSRESEINSYSADLSFNYFIGKSTLNIGFKLLGYDTRYSYGDTENDEVTDFATDIGLFIKYKYIFNKKLIIEPGFRLQSYISQKAASPEPRLAIKYNINEKVRLKLAGGLYSQNYVSISSDRDVVNLFAGYMSSVNSSSVPNYFLDGEELDNTIQKAQHAIFGVELDVIKKTTINIEGYVKNFSVLTSVNRYKMFDNNTSNEDVADILKKDYMWETGIAYGGDVSVKFEHKGMYLWVAYSLGWAKRTDAVLTYSPHFDRRHNLNIVASYSWGKRQSWQVDARWNFGTGFPFTQTQAFYPYMDMLGGLDYDYISTNEELSFILSDLNEGRLPTYHRLDLSAKKTFYMGERHSLAVALSATNVYNMKNIFYVNRTTNEIIYQLPFMYNVGVTWSF
ncbi:MAG: TonB-dependent receptor [Bacteroidales bacterium]|jgi:hypothetical protein|nr:TonB-dependent receptor [Bacteroidales bacterium]